MKKKGEAWGSGNQSMLGAPCGTLLGCLSGLWREASSPPVTPTQHPHGYSGRKQTEEMQNPYSLSKVFHPQIPEPPSPQCCEVTGAWSPTPSPTDSRRRARRGRFSEKLRISMQKRQNSLEGLFRLLHQTRLSSKMDEIKVVVFPPPRSQELVRKTVTVENQTRHISIVHPRSSLNGLRTSYVCVCIRVCALGTSKTQFLHLLDEDE